ncbi:MAG: MerR family transcriptional regulator [Flavobacteriales bacterium]|jgi:DNA-binding transcriptional MerR regulator|nr:MerR family transcriptional regulator [Flavobacteriales bacterium]
MPYKERPVGKMFWSIGEVAAELGVNTSLIRYWEKEFGTLRPRRTGRGDRLFTRKDIDHLKRIQHLVKEQGFTLSGAKEQLRQGTAEASPAPDHRAELVQRLQRVRQELLALRAACE